MPKINKTDQTKYVKKLLDKWTKIMHLSNWEFEIVHLTGADDEGTFLSLIPCHIYCKARIKVWPLYWAQNKDIQEQGIVHELVHCKLEPLSAIAYDLLNGKLQTAKTIQDTIEQVTQNLSTIISPLKNRFYLDGNKKN